MAYKDDKHLNLGAPTRYERGFDPLLVCLHDSAKNYEGSRDKTSFENLVHSVIAILDARLSETEKILAADVLITLIRQAEQELRSSLAERLAVRDDLPNSLLHFLAYAEIDIAEAVLLYSPLLSDTDLLYIIQSKAQDHWRAIARRAEIGESVSVALSEKEDEKTNLNLLLNESLDLTEDALTFICKGASVSEELAHELICYKSLPKSVATRVYWHVASDLRKKITEKFDIHYKDIDASLEDCIQDFVDTSDHLQTMRPSELMFEVAERYEKQERITETLLVNILRKRQGRFFIALFSVFSSLSPYTVFDMMKQKGGQGLAVSCRALGIKKENFVSMFLLSRTITTPNAVVEAEEMKMAMRYYDSLTHKMAKEILNESIV